MIVHFPFSDLSGAKKRPALVIKKLNGDDLIICQITSQKKRDKYAVSLKEEDFLTGSLMMKSVVRPNRIFTADKRIVLKKVGNVKPEKINEVVRAVIKIISN